MNDVGASIFLPAAVRARILEQHRLLRELLHQSLDATTRTFAGDEPGVDELARLIHDLRARFGAHLAFEERALFPLLTRLDAWGPERIADLQHEHLRQQGQLDTLAEGIASSWDRERLALTLRSLVTDLFLDMDDEERGCLDCDFLRDQLVMVGSLRE